MKIVRYQNLDIKETPHGVDVRELYSKESAQAMHITLKPGESLKPHITPVDVFFFILQGSPTVHVGNEAEVCSPDSLVESPAGIVHYLSNPSGNTARILVVKAPKPVKSARLL